MCLYDETNEIEKNNVRDKLTIYVVGVGGVGGGDDVGGVDGGGGVGGIDVGGGVIVGDDVDGVDGGGGVGGTDGGGVVIGDVLFIFIHLFFTTSHDIMFVIFLFTSETSFGYQTITFSCHLSRVIETLARSTSKQIQRGVTVWEWNHDHLVCRYGIFELVGIRFF